MNRLEVYKFGGVAMGTPDAVRGAAERVAAAPARLAVVVSAMSGVTDLLLGAAQSALAGDEAGYRDAAERFAARHLELVDALFPHGRDTDGRGAGGRDASGRAAALRSLVAEAADELRAMCESVAVLRELTPRARDTVVARGERTLARIFAAYLEERGIASAYVDAVEVIVTERRLGGLWPSFPRCARLARERLAPLLAGGRTVVVPGFLGRGPEGELVTLGRGGTDFSAAILARSLGAAAVTLWKEVDGLMTADPRSVPSARLLPALHYREAAELAYYGARVLHPRTMVPLADRRIPLFVRSAFRPEIAGTRIAHDVGEGGYPVKALTAIHGQALVSIDGGGMIGVPGVAGRAFSALSQAGHSVVMISQSSSEASICFVVPEAEAGHAVAALEETFRLERRDRLIERIAAERGVALIAVVGLGMRGRKGIAARTFGALSGAGVNVMAVAQGSSELNITIAVLERDATRALQALHDEFQLAKVRPLSDSAPRGASLAMLGFGQIGRALAEQLAAQGRHLERELGVRLVVTAVADRSGVRAAEAGLSTRELAALARRKARGERLHPGGAVLGLEALRERLRAELWPLPARRPILVDLTSEETAPLLLEALAEGFHVVLANKKPLAGPQAEYDRLVETARERGLELRYEATAGAGLPVLDTLAKLRESGDRVESILGCFSGTLGYLMTALEGGRPFSEAVREAWRLGYTEPDPREDLSGRDVARKALILARALGRRLEPDQVALEPLFPPELDAGDDAFDPARFVDGLAALDDSFARRLARARRDGNTLRYVARIGPRSLKVGIEAVPAASPMGGLRGTANQVVIHSRRYRENPLIVTGPGAGADVTAAGVLNDLVAIAVQERRAPGGRGA